MDFYEIFGEICLSLAEEIKKIALFGSALVGFFMDPSANKGTTIMVVIIFWSCTQLIANAILIAGKMCLKREKSDE